MDSFSKNVEHIYSIFHGCTEPSDRYKKLIELGKELPPMPSPLQVEENLVPGCQSLVYLHPTLREGKIFFTAASDALISSGLANLLLLAYNGESPETLLKEKPTFLESLGISASLSPNRSNGLASIFLKMQKHALHFLIHS